MEHPGGLRAESPSGFLLNQIMHGERDHVVPTFAQGRHANLDLRKAVVEVRAKPALAGGRFQILVGRGDEADIDRNLFDAADAEVAGAVEHAQQLHLHAQVEIADLVEK